MTINFDANMDNDRFLLNKGLFAQQTLRKIKVPDSYDTILNLLKTIQEYREFTHPDSDNWIEYIQDVFHLLGFSTRFYNQRLLLISEMGYISSTEILVGMSLPEENITNIVPWLEWTELLSLVARSMNIRWGIMTNGIELKINDFSINNYSEKYYWANIEKIITHSNNESFFSFYKVLFYLRRTLEEPYMIRVNKTHKQKSYRNKNFGKRYQEKQAEKIGETIPNFVIHPSLSRSIDLYFEMTTNGISFLEACDIVAKKRGILSATVRQDLAARLHISSQRFSTLIKDKSGFASHLKTCFPKDSDYVEDLLENS